jgi:hypothetical protein
MKSIRLVSRLSLKMTQKRRWTVKDSKGDKEGRKGPGSADVSKA